MTRHPGRPRVGKHVRVAHDGHVEPGTVQYYPTSHGDGVTFPVRGDRTGVTIQTWRGDPRLIEDEDDT